MKLARIALPIALVCAVFAVSQARAEEHESKTAEYDEHNVAAFVYVSSIPANSKVSVIRAYAMNKSGRLTPVPGSPYPEAVGTMAVNGSYLMGASQTSADINTYRIEDDGSLTRMGTMDYAQFNNPGGPECGSAGQIYFDHTGQSLYVQQYNGSNACANTVVGAFGVQKGTGDLGYLNTAVTGVFPGDWTAASFTGNNQFAYTADNDNCMYYTIYGFKRSSNGALNLIPVNYNLPKPGSSFSRYIPYFAAADGSNHIAFTMQPANPPGCAPGPLQLATYTFDSNGNLSTTSTYANMPATHIVTPYDLKMSPSGKLLAVAGQEGLQIFHFNGAAPITHYTALLTSDPVNQVFWDNANHLYAISTKTGKLRVYTVTPTSFQEMPGSPYSVSSPQGLAVQPWPLSWDKD